MTTLKAVTIMRPSEPAASPELNSFNRSQASHLGRRKYVQAAVISMVLMLLASISATAQTTPVPAQFIVKVYSEANGAAPTAAQYNQWSTAFSQNPCAGTMQYMIQTLFRNQPFTTAYPETNAKPQRIIALIRAAFNRDPTSMDWTNYYTNKYAMGTSWDSTMTSVFNDAAYTATTNAVCTSSPPSYGWGYSASNPPLDIYQLVTGVASRTEATIQGLLQSQASSCGTVYLQPMEVIRVGGNQPPGDPVNQGLVVPPCVTLATQGNPGPGFYASMARIVPQGLTCYATYFCNHEPIVALSAGARLTNVWVDGNGLDPGQSQTANVESINTIPAGSGSSLGSVNANNNGGLVATQIVNNRLSDPGRNGTAIRLDGWGTTGVPCASPTLPVMVQNNLLTGYATSYAQDSLGRGLWADGIADECENTVISNNQLVDLTGRGISIGGERYRLPVPPAPTATTVNGSSSLNPGVYEVFATYQWTNSPMLGTAESNFSPSSAPCTGSGATLGCNLGGAIGTEQIQVGSFSNIPPGVSSVNLYLYSSYSTTSGGVTTINTATNLVTTLPVSSGTAPAYTITTIGSSAAPTTLWATGSLRATQASQVSNNTIVNAGNSAFAALAADPAGECIAAYAETNPIAFSPETCLDLPDITDDAGTRDYRDFTGSNVSNNTYWTSPRASLYAGLLIGDGAPLGLGAAKGTNATFTNNTIGVSPTNVNMGISTSLMYNINLQGNDVSHFALVNANTNSAGHSVAYNACPQEIWGYSSPYEASFVSGSQTPPTGQVETDCMTAPPPVTMDKITVAAGGKTFQGATTGVRFNPVGVNYLNTDLLSEVGAGGDLSQYQHDFRQLKDQGYNSLRVFVRFSDVVVQSGAGSKTGAPNYTNLVLLRNIAQLAQDNGLYLNVTGLWDLVGPTTSSTPITAGTSGRVTLTVGSTYGMNVGQNLTLGAPGNTQPEETVTINAVGACTTVANCTVAVSPASGGNFLYTRSSAYGVTPAQFEPQWYGDLTANGSDGFPDDRWNTQALFWQYLASQFNGLQNILDYQLISEALDQSGSGVQTYWQGSACNGSCFGGTIDLADPVHSDTQIVQAWLTRMIDAIKFVSGDTQTLITVGSQSEGFSGFVPGIFGLWTGTRGEKIDFFSPHIYSSPSAAGAQLGIYDLAFWQEYPAPPAYSTVPPANSTPYNKPVVIDETGIWGFGTSDGGAIMQFLTEAEAQNFATGYYHIIKSDVPVSSLLQLNTPPGFSTAPPVYDNGCSDQTQSGVWVYQTTGEYVNALQNLASPIGSNIP